MNTFDAVVQRELEDLRRADLLRARTEIASAQGARIQIGGREFLNFSSNDYLGLAGDPRLNAAAAAALQRWGVGAGASRLICGTQSPHAELERKLAAFKRKESALVFSSGYAANVGTIPALVGKGDLIICDKLNHASIIDAARLSGATLRVYPHGNLKRLRALLEGSGRFRRRLVITETVFSMDGDFAPLREIVELKDRFGAWLMVDEAHATGIFGAHRRGAAELFGVEDRIEVTMGTLSKALGAAGGFVCGSRVLIEALVNRARSFLYSTAPPAAVCAAAAAALAVVQSEPQRVQRLLENARRLRQGISNLELEIPEGCSPIVPVLLGESARALEVSRRLGEEGIFAPAIRPPTVPRGRARVRLSVSAVHTEEEIARLITVLPKAVATGQDMA